MRSKFPALRAGLFVASLVLANCGGPTPPPESTAVDRSIEQQRLSQIAAAIRMDDKAALQYQAFLAQQRATLQAQQREEMRIEHLEARKEFIEDDAREQRHRERLLQILASHKGRW